jgi:hypothetical protein
LVYVEYNTNFKDTTKNIHITLKVEVIIHFGIRKDQALELNEVGFRDSVDLSDSQLKENFIQITIGTDINNFLTLGL